MGTISMKIYDRVCMGLIALFIGLLWLSSGLDIPKLPEKPIDSYKCRYESMLLMAKYRPLTPEEFEKIEDRLTTWANYNPRFLYTSRPRYDADIRDFSTNGVSIKWNRKLIVDNSSQPITLDAE